MQKFPEPDRGHAWQLAAVALAVVASVLLLVVPTGTSETTTSTGEHTSESTTLLGTEGPSVLWPLLVPVLLTLVPLLVSRRLRPAVSITCTVLLAVGVILAVLSIGVFFVPALVLAVIACVRTLAR